MNRWILTGVGTCFAILVSSSALPQIANADNVTYYAYEKNGQLLTTWDTVTGLLSVVASYPGGYITNASGQREYTVPDFIAYTKDGHPLYEWTSVTGLVPLLQEHPGGYIDTASGVREYTEPDFIAYTKSGSKIYEWTSVSGLLGLMGNYPGGIIKSANGTIEYVEPDYFAYDDVGHQLYEWSSVTGLIPILAHYPGGYITDAAGNRLYTEPPATYDVYVSPTATPIQTGQDGVSTDLSGHPTGFAVNHDTGAVYQMPSTYFYCTQSGTWEDQSGKTSTAPQFAVSGTYYIPTGNSLNQYYAFAKDSGGSKQFIGVKLAGEFSSVDLRTFAPSAVSASSIDSFLLKNSYHPDSPLTGLGHAMMSGQSIYGVNATYLLAHSIEETGWGTNQGNYAVKNNLYGYGIYSSSTPANIGVFPSKEYAVLFQAWEVRNNYLDPTTATHYGGSPTLDGMYSAGYATGSTWTSNISTLMNEVATSVGGSVNDYTQYQSSNSVPKPNSTQEPVYYFAGATGNALAADGYSGLPVYQGTDWTNAASNMFIPLQLNDQGDRVKQLQDFLNTKISANLIPDKTLTKDGDFGPLTQQALEDYQKYEKVTVTGVVDEPLWEQIDSNARPYDVVPAGGTVAVEKEMQGMFNGYATDWYYVTYGSSISGWVNADDLSLNNVYQFQAASGNYGIFSNQYVHNGDYVAYDAKTSEIEFCDANGNVYTAKVGSVSGWNRVTTPGS